MRDARRFVRAARARAARARAARARAARARAARARFARTRRFLRVFLPFARRLGRKVCASDARRTRNRVDARRTLDGRSFGASFAPAARGPGRRVLDAQEVRAAASVAVERARRVGVGRERVGPRGRRASRGGRRLPAAPAEHLPQRRRGAAPPRAHLAGVSARAVRVVRPLLAQTHERSHRRLRAPARVFVAEVEGVFSPASFRARSSRVGVERRERSVRERTRERTRTRTRTRRARTRAASVSSHGALERGATSLDEASLLVARPRARRRRVGFGPRAAEPLLLRRRFVRQHRAFLPLALEELLEPLDVIPADVGPVRLDLVAFARLDGVEKVERVAEAPRADERDALLAHGAELRRPPRRVPVEPRRELRLERGGVGAVAVAHRELEGRASVAERREPRVPRRVVRLARVAIARVEILEPAEGVRQGVVLRVVAGHARRERAVPGRGGRVAGRRRAAARRERARRHRASASAARRARAPTPAPGINGRRCALVLRSSISFSLFETARPLEKPLPANLARHDDACRTPPRVPRDARVSWLS